MAQYRVVCINSAPAASPYGHSHITHLGLATTSGVQRVTREWVIQELRNPHGHRFYTVSPSTGQRAWVIEAGCEVCGIKPYVRTTADGIYDNNLLSLDLCPVS